ncbi:MAG: hypothetical protein ACRETU_13860, partial [Steroidobacterales bacterium]
MKTPQIRIPAVFAALSVLLTLIATNSPAQEPRAQTPSTSIANLQPFLDPTGAIATYSERGRVETNGAFFQSLGTNGRSCATCHAVDQAMSISPAQIRARFLRTNGADPLFAAVDGANCTNGVRSDPRSHSLLLRNGLIRVGIVLPANAQFTLSVVHDPYGCALKLDPASGQWIASVYRRPLPATNLGFLNSVMWDGRETVSPLASYATYLANLRADLKHQATDATLGHAQAAVAPTDAQVEDIVQFEFELYTAQIRDRQAGWLDARGAEGGPAYLSDEEYYPGVNDVLGADPFGAPFTASSMTLYSAWATAGDTDADALLPADRAAARRDLAAGEAIFNSARLTISTVRGVNDNAALGRPSSLQGTCTTCHDTPNIGNHSLPLPLDIGVGHVSRSGFESDALVAKGVAQLDEPDLPVFLVQGCANPFGGGQAASFYTTDPGKALLTGQCSDLNRLKGPILRGLAARAPYFHNGSASNLLDVVNFYD